MTAEYLTSTYMKSKNLQTYGEHYLEAARRMEGSRLAREIASPGLDTAHDLFTEHVMMAKQYTTRLARGCGAEEGEF